MALLDSPDASATPAIVDVTPADGSIVARCPERVLVRFSQGIDSRVTRVWVVGPTDSSSTVAEGKPPRPIAQLSIPVPNQGHGAYAVRWEIVARGGKKVSGRTRFVVERR